MNSKLVFDYHGKPRNSGATTDLLWAAYRFALSNPDKKAYCVFGGNNYFHRYVVELIPFDIPANMILASVGTPEDGLRGLRGKVFIDGSVELHNTNHDLRYWSYVAYY